MACGESYEMGFLDWVEPEIPVDNELAFRLGKEIAMVHTLFRYVPSKFDACVHHMNRDRVQQMADHFGRKCVWKPAHNMDDYERLLVEEA